MNRSSSTLALALLAALTLSVTACSAGTAPDVGGESAPPTSTAPAAEPETPTASPDPTDPSESALSDEQRRCELMIMQTFNDRDPQPATAEDVAAVAAAIEMAVLPGTLTCGAVMDDGAYTQLIWVDQPMVAPEMLRVLDTRAWEQFEEQASGYLITGYTTDAFTVSVAPIGVDNAMSVWGSAWPGMDVTIVGFETS